MKTLFSFLLISLISISSHGVITFIGSTVDTGDEHFSNLTVPNNVVADDLLITQVTYKDPFFGSSGGDNVTTPSGWTRLAPREQDDNVFQIIYYKVATSSDPNTTHTWDFDTSTDRRYVVGMSVFRGVDPINPIDTENAQTGMNGVNITAPAITTSNANAMLVAFYTLEDGNRTFTPASGMTEIYDRTSYNGSFRSNGISSMASFDIASNAGNTGRKRARASKSNDDAIGHLVALNEKVIVLPTIDSISFSCSSLNTVSINFSENLNTGTAENTSNYSVTNPSGNNLSISSASLSGSVVNLTLASSLNDLTSYDVVVNNVENLSGNAILPNSSDSFRISCDLNCITDNFAGPGSLSSSWSVGNSSGSFGDPRIVSNGRLRLTDNSGNVSTVATLLNQFPGAENRVEIEFDYYGYAGSGADGIAVNFSDASVAPSAGAFGGSLGYAQKTGINGFSGGWLGVGIDEYGNFSTSGEGRVGGNGSRTTDSVSLRGSGSGTSGYPFLTSTGSLSPGIDQSGGTPNPGHRYRIVIDHTAGGGVATTSVERDTGSGFSAIVPSFNIFSVNPSQAAVPANWVVSFTGSTGGSSNIHEIGDLKVCAAQPIQTFSQVDHYDITHTSPGLTCEGSEVTITAHDASHGVVNVLSDTSITVTTTPSISNIVSSPVTMLAGTSTATVYLQHTSVLNNIDIDVSDGDKTDDEGSSEDPRISFLDTAFRFYADGSFTGSTPITTQISGKPTNTAPNVQALTLRAIEKDTDTGACVAGVTGAQSVNIAYQCKNPLNCSSTSLEFTGSGSSSTPITGTNNGAGLNYTAVNMVFSNAGSAPFNFSLADAGMIDLHASLTVPATVSPPNPEFTLIGSSNEFVVRPFAFDLIFGSDSTAADHTQSKFVTAGSNFPIQIRAVNWNTADDSDSDGIVDINSTTGEVSDLSNNPITPNFGNEISAQSLSFSRILDQPALGPLPMGQAGVFTFSAVNAGGSTSDFTNGITPDIGSTTPAAKTMNWSEVGIIDISAQLNNYLSAAGANINGQANNIGRFYPHHFEMTSQGVLNSCGTFSYMGQSGIEIEYTLQAQNESGNVTQNYHGVFAKATTNLAVENDNDAGSYEARLINFNNESWANGIYDYSDEGAFSRADLGLVDGPYGMLQVGVRLTNNEVPILNLDMKADTNTNCSALGDCDAKLVGSIDARFGQLKLSNVFGPEEFDLDMTARTEYYNGSQFVLNTDDSCTDLIIALPNYIFKNWTGNLVLNETTPSLLLDAITGKGINSGLGVIQFSAAEIGNDGSVTFEYDTESFLPWLSTENDDDADYRDNPEGVVSFGQFRGNDRMIYWREIVR